MPTTDELQAQINALQSQLNSILGMADDDYIHQYSGEEIDAGITAAGKAVRYDLAQSLTAAQQTQARGNIGAAPDGYGLGGNEGQTAVSMDFDQLTKNGWYTTQSETANAPVDPVSSQRTLIGALHVVSRSLNSVVVQTLYVWQNSVGFNRSGTLRRIRRNGTWEEWEWIDPPMELTAEYRTTERYLGKPVYTMAFSFGALPNASDKVVAMPGTDTTCKIIEIHGYASNEMTLPGVSGTSTGSQVTLTGVGNRAYVITGSDRSSATATIVAKYIKTTD